MKVEFDFLVHWVWAIVYSLLCFSGVGMMGAKYGWILNYNIALADAVHRIASAIFVILTFISIFFEIFKTIKTDTKKSIWHLFGKRGYSLFNFITSLIFIITGAIIWVCMGSNMAATSFALYIHEKLTFIVVASVIYHIYKKSHALVVHIQKQNISV